MESSKNFDGNAFTVDDDKDDLIPEDQDPVIGKGGHVIESRGSVDLQKDGARGESSPLHTHKETPLSGKDLHSSHGLRIIVGVAFVFSFVITVALILTIYLGHGQIGSSGAVAADCTDCSNLGLGILEQGGNAVDAAVTAMLCTGIVNPDASGIGGGGHMLIFDLQKEKSTVFDFRETAPHSATQNMFAGRRENAEKGGISVAVPGELKGMELAHKKYGLLPWKSVVQPAANLARNGFKVPRSLATSLRICGAKDFTKGNFQIYLKPNGKLVKEGDIVKNELLADTLDIIAEKGSKAFYDGELTQGILDAVNEGYAKPIMSRKDLKNYKVIERKAVYTDYHGQRIVTVPAPASGLVILSIMNILEGYNLKPSDFKTNKAETLHKIIEAMKFGYAQQQSLADPDFEPSVINTTKQMLDKTEAKRLMNKTKESDSTFDDPQYYGGVLAKSTERGTSHISVIDSQELFVSCTTSVNDWFGSHVITEHGIILNNQMADFADPQNPDTKHSTLNYIEPGKRPQSNMSPLVMYHRESKCKLKLCIGGTHWTRICTGVTQVLLNSVSFDLPMENAIEEPRIHTELYPMDVLYEDGFSKKVIEELEKKGYNMVNSSDYLSVVQGIQKVNDKISAISDPREGGQAAMYNSND